MLTLSNPRTAKEEKQTQKELQDEIAHVVEGLDSRPLFFAPSGVLEKWEICPRKSFNFLLKKGYGPFE